MDARHIRGLEEKIWNVFAPSAAAFNAAFSSDPAMDVWMPIRRLLCYQLLTRRPCRGRGRSAGKNRSLTVAAL
jgi:hypothetical protein